MNYDGTQAGGYYQEDRGNDGNIVLDFENGELYLTVTCRSGGNWAMTMEHEHCTLDPNGVYRRNMQIPTCRLTPSPDMTIIQMDKPFRGGS